MHLIQTYAAELCQPDYTSHRTSVLPKGIRRYHRADLGGQNAIRRVQGLPAAALQLLHHTALRIAPATPDAAQHLYKLPISLQKDLKMRR